MAGKKNEGVQTIAIPKDFVPEIEAIISEFEDEHYSINSFCRAAVKQMIEMMNTPPGERTEPKLVRMFDAAKNRGAALQTANSGARLRPADEAASEAAARAALEAHGQSPPTRGPSAGASHTSKASGKGQGGQQ